MPKQVFQPEWSFNAADAYYPGFIFVAIFIEAAGFFLIATLTM
jgi:hypothetical protein